MFLYGFGRRVLAPICRVLFRIRVEGLENIPQEGGAILCSNHFHFLDPLMVGIASPRTVQFMAKQEIFETPVLGTIARGLGAFPVKRGQPDRAALKRSIDLLQSGHCFGIFPEGTRSRTGTLRKAEPGTAYLAIKSGAPIIPVGIYSSYRLRSLVRIRFGPPIDLTAYGGGRLSGDSLEGAGEAIMSAIARLLEVDPKGAK